MDTSRALDDMTAKHWDDRRTPGNTGGTTEACLTRLWADVLELDRVEPDDNFFLLGGDSLRAAALFAEIEAAFGVALPLETVFDEGETVAGMAALIERATEAPPDAVPADPAEHGTATGSTHGSAAGKLTAPLFARGDTTAALTLLLLSVAAWLPRRAALPALCRALARAHVALRGARDVDPVPATALLAADATAREIEIGGLAGIYEDMADALRDYLPRLSRPAVRLSGREHIEAALAAGHGAVLWNFAARIGSRAAAERLKAAGTPVVQLRGSVHPLSGSRFGTAVLNPILNRIEDRGLAGCITFDDGNAVEAMRALGRHLRGNAVVRLSAHGSGDTPHEMPFLGGTLRLALGAPTLALLHGAPLLPIFTIPDGTGGFHVIVEPPLAPVSEAATGEVARMLAERYADRLEPYVRQYPHLWRGWFMRNTWRPGPRDRHDA